MKSKDNKYDYPLPEGYYKAIREWRDDEKPRERLVKHGAETLSDAELLAILIRTGSRKFSALDAARALLEKNTSLTKLSSCDISQFKHIKGLGVAKAVTLAAAFEIGKRIKAEPFDKQKTIKTPEEISRYYIPRFIGDRTEKFMTLLLNSSNQIFRESIITEGILNSTIVHPREVFRLAITESAASVILLHNHPSGNPEPSKEDSEITKKMVAAGNLIDIKVIDHIIIAGDKFYSFAQKGLL